MCKLLVDPLNPILSLFPESSFTLRELLQPCRGHTFRIQKPQPDIDNIAKNSIPWLDCVCAKIVTDPKTAWDENNWTSIGSTLPHNQQGAKSKIFSLSAHTIDRVDKMLVHIPWHDLNVSLTNFALRDHIAGGHTTKGSFASCLFNAIEYTAVDEEPYASGLKNLIHVLWLKGNYPIAYNKYTEKLVIVCAKP